MIEHCRCYHLISRLYPPAVRLLAKRGAMRGAHQAFFLDDDEKARAVELLRRVEEFSGVIVLAYAIMANHFHIFIYVPEPEEIGTAGGRSDEAVGIRSCIHFNRYYLSPLLEKGVIDRTDPDHPQSPQQRYCLT